MLWYRPYFFIFFSVLVASPSYGGQTKIDSNADLDVEAALAARTVGSEDASVTVVEYFSFTCPHCADFHTETYPKLKKKYIDTGRIKFEFRDFPLDQWALRAAALARCVPKEFYEPMVSVLMKQQSSWVRSEDISGALVKLGQLAGLSRSRAETCMKDTKLLDGIVGMRMEGNRKYGIDTTPSFLLDTKKIKAFEFGEFDKLLIKELD